MPSYEVDESVFFGRLTASTSHDLQNVLAIIKESAGLMGDYLHMAENSGEVHPAADKLKSGISKIQTQVARGVAMTTHLNRFSHLPDHRPDHVDVGEALSLFVGMAGRMARISDIRIAVDTREDMPGLTTCPVCFQMLLLAILDFFKGVMPDGGPLVFQPGMRGETPVLSVVCSETVFDRDSVPKDSLDQVTGLAENLSFGVQFSSVGMDVVF